MTRGAQSRSFEPGRADARRWKPTGRCRGPTHRWRPWALVICVLSLASPQGRPCAQEAEEAGRLAENAGLQGDARRQSGRVLQTPPPLEERVYRPGVRVQPTLPREPILKSIVLFPFRVIGIPIRWLGQGLAATLGFVEREALLVRTQRLVRVLAERGYFPIFGGFPDGAGFAAGLEIRRQAGPAELSLMGGASVFGYVEARASVEYPAAGRGMTMAGRDGFGLTVEGMFSRRTREEFYGIGQDSREQARSVYGRHIFDGRGRVGLPVGRRVAMELGAGFVQMDLIDAIHPSLPSIDEVFDGLPAQAQGRFQALYGTLAMEYEGRDVPGNPSRGIYLRLEAGVRHALDEDFSHSYTDSYASGIVPLGGRRTFSVWGQLMTVHRVGDDEIPFFLLPRIGGSETLKAYQRFRFADEAAGLISAEYAFMISPEPNLAFFAFGQLGGVGEEVGQVFQDIKPSVGFGIRFLTSTSTAARLELAFGDEGSRFWLKLGGAR
jgi:hypothetical protein